MKIQSESEQYFYFVNRNFYVANLLCERLEELNTHNTLPELHKVIDITIKMLHEHVINMDNKLKKLALPEDQESAQDVILLLESLFNRIICAGTGIEIVHLYDYICIADALLARTVSQILLMDAKSANYNEENEHLTVQFALRPAMIYLAENFDAVA